jgi:hypothetical protein
MVRRMNNHAPDLTINAPRSPRVRLGGYPILPRALDKCRAELAGKNGEYHYNCPLDQRFLNFAGVDAEALKLQIAKGNGDGELLEWIRANSKNQPNEVEIAAFAAFSEQRVAADSGAREFFNGEATRIGPNRDDIATWFELLDLDDYVSFGGKA